MSRNTGKVRGRKLLDAREVLADRGASHVLSRGEVAIRFTSDAADSARVEVSSDGWHGRWSVVVRVSEARTFWRAALRSGFERREAHEGLRSAA